MEGRPFERDIKREEGKNPPPTCRSLCSCTRQKPRSCAPRTSEREGEEKRSGTSDTSISEAQISELVIPLLVLGDKLGLDPTKKNDQFWLLLILAMAIYPSP